MCGYQEKQKQRIRQWQWELATLFPILHPHRHHSPWLCARLLRPPTRPRPRPRRRLFHSPIQPAFFLGLSFSSELGITHTHPHTLLPMHICTLTDFVLFTPHFISIFIVSIANPVTTASRPRTPGLPNPPDSPCTPPPLSSRHSLEMHPLQASRRQRGMPRQAVPPFVPLPVCA